MPSYLRLFSMLSLVTVMTIAVIGGVYLRTLSQNDLAHQTENNNTRLVKGYINTVWNKYRAVIVPLASDPAKLQNNSAVVQFAQETARYFEPMPLIRANIYNGNGTLLFSVSINSASKSLSNTPTPTSSSVRNLSIIPGKIYNLLADDTSWENTTGSALVQTIVPIHTSGIDALDGTPTEGAVEVLSDITQPWAQIINLQLFCMAEIIIGFLIFLCILIMTSHKTEAIIARQHEANQELAAAAAAAQEENLQKSQFMANVSHELRTPLNAIIGFSEIIKNEVIGTETDKKYQDYINDIHSSGVHLLSLINDILDYSKAEAGKLELEVTEVNATKMIQNCMRLLGPRAEMGQVKLIESLPKEQFIMSSDGKRFKQILLNLLSNAVKFTPPGGEVRVTGWGNLANDSITFEVQDTGIGIAPKDISRAMAPFGQVDNTLKRKYEGTGLGLPLTKKFVELMGGKFTIESTLNVGTKIIFTLPRQITQRDEAIIKQA